MPLVREVVEEVRAGGRREERVVALLTKLVDKAEAGSHIV